MTNDIMTSVLRLDRGGEKVKASKREGPLTPGSGSYLRGEAHLWVGGHVPARSQLFVVVQEDAGNGERKRMKESRGEQKRGEESRLD